MTYDVTERVGKSVLQHGPNNNRVYLMKMHPDDLHEVLERIDQLVKENTYTKIIANVPDPNVESFIQRGYRREARIPCYYGPGCGGNFLAKYFEDSRGSLSEEEVSLIHKVRELVDAAGRPKGQTLQKNWSLRRLGAGDVASLVQVYEKVFDVYPFPIFEPAHILRTMREGHYYYGIFEEGRLIAVSSADVEPKYSHAEMTDFATLPGYRGNNLSFFLLQAMVWDLQQESIRLLYTIARANSIGMNKTFKRLGFELCGTLVHNTCIGSSIENMHVWCRLSEASGSESCKP